MPSVSALPVSPAARRRSRCGRLVRSRRSPACTYNATRRPRVAGPDVRHVPAGCSRSRPDRGRGGVRPARSPPGRPTRTRFSPRRSACCSGTSSRDRRRRGRSRAAPTQADRLRTNGANTQNRRMQVQHTQGRQQRSMTRRSPTRVGQRRWMSEEPQPGHETVMARGVLSVRGPGSAERASTTKPSTTAGQQREGGQRQSLCGVSFRGPRRRTRWRCVPLAVRWRARFQDDRRRRSVRP